MKKNMLLTGLLVLTLFCAIGCGRRMNSATDGTDKNDTTTENQVNDTNKNDMNNNDTDKNDMNNNDTDRNDNIVDGMMDGVEDTVDGVIDGSEDVVNGVENSLDTPPSDNNPNEKVLPDNNDNTVNDQHNINDQRNRTR